MSLFLTGKIVSGVPWLAASIFWSLGGWLLVVHAFNLEKKGRFLIGSGLGLVLYVWLVNLLGQFLLPWLAFSLPAIIVFSLGMFYAWQSERPFFPWEDLLEWRLLLVFLLIVYIELQIGRGLGIFDDRKNISLISLIAGGDIPPHFYMNPALRFEYHYGFQIFGASLMKLGGLFPWTAFDLGKAFMIAYVLIFVALLGLRYTGSLNSAVLITVVFTFATGTMYLLNLAPTPILDRLDWSIKLVGPDPVVGMRFSEALREIVTFNDPAPPFMFSYMNGITSWPFMLSQAGPNSFGWMIILLAWLLASKHEKKGNFWIFAVLFSMLALAWEVYYVLVFLGGAGVFVLSKIQNKEMDKALLWGLLASVPFVLLQGGTISGMAFSILSGNKSVGVGNEESLLGFIFQWPPALYSSRLGFLRISSPGELLALIMEIGPVIFFVPWIVWWGWKRFQEQDEMVSMLTLSSLAGFMISLVVYYRRAHDTVRITAYTARLWTLFLVVMIWEYDKLWAKQFRRLASIGLAAMVFGGVVAGGTMLTAASQPMLANDIYALDAKIARDNWGKLEEGDVFDSHSWRTVPILGRATRAASGHYTLTPEWESLREDPSVEALLERGFRYVYLDEEWWKNFSEEAKNEFSAGCVEVISEYSAGDDFRRLVDIEKCEK